MDFTLSDEQEMLRDTARALFTKEFPSTLLRDAAYDVTDAGPAEARAVFHAHLRDWFALGDPGVGAGGAAAAGGSSLVDLCLFLEESGTAVVDGPLWSSAALCLPLLRAIGHPDADAVAAGELTGTVALAGADGHWVPNTEPTKCFVPDAASVDRVAFVSAAGAGAGGGAEVVVADAARLTMREVATLDRSRAVFEVAVPADGADSSPIAADALTDVLERATVALAAELVGAARWLREATLAYVGERVQFGRPVGSFQGLQWMLVDAALVHERATAAVYYAAMCIDADDPDRHSAVHVAKAAAGSAARRWAKDGLQAHGGIGYTWEHDLHLRLRRAYAADHLLGDTDWHHDRLADLIF